MVRVYNRSVVLPFPRSPKPLPTGTRKLDLQNVKEVAGKFA
jgi:hypothetical protein